MVPRIRFRYACRTWLNALSSPLLARSISSNSISTATARTADHIPGGNRTLIYPQEKAHTSSVRLQYPWSFGALGWKECAGPSALCRAGQASERRLLDALDQPCARARPVGWRKKQCVPLRAVNQLIQSCLSATEVGKSCPDYAGRLGGGVAYHDLSWQPWFTPISRTRAGCDVLDRLSGTITLKSYSTYTLIREYRRQRRARKPPHAKIAVFMDFLEGL